MTVLAIDQGTSGTKAIVVGPDGRVIASSQCEMCPDYRRSGAVEQDPRELLESVLTAGRRAVEEGGARIDVVALANQG
ncbi:MAG: FGGY family carbohydrate kinase, partial [Candidatus Nanopelagicales bacterium]